MNNFMLGVLWTCFSILIFLSFVNLLSWYKSRKKVDIETHTSDTRLDFDRYHAVPINDNKSERVVLWSVPITMHPKEYIIDQKIEIMDDGKLIKTYDLEMLVKIDIDMTGKVVLSTDGFGKNNTVFKDKNEKPELVVKREIHEIKYDSNGIKYYD